jgi:CRISPR/Cas system-associated exonuclease Cas4 (RecB family)
MNCPNCNITLVTALQKVTVSTVQELSFCPKCNYERLGEITEGFMEIEENKRLLLKSTEINAKQISWLRKLNSDLSNMSSKELKNKLLNGLLLEELSYEEYHDIYSKSQDLKIKTEQIEQEF